MKMNPDDLARMTAAGQVVGSAAVNVAALLAASTPQPPEEAPAGKAKRKRGKLNHNAFAMTEEQLQKMVIDLAHVRGWIVAHFRPAWAGEDENRRMITPVAADGKGFPDLVLVRERVVYAELKSAAGVIRPDQQVWLDKLTAAGAEVYVWYPKNWKDIVRILT